MYTKKSLNYIAQENFHNFEPTSNCVQESPSLIPKWPKFESDYSLVFAGVLADEADPLARQLGQLRVDLAVPRNWNQQGTMKEINDWRIFAYRFSRTICKCIRDSRTQLLQNYFGWVGADTEVFKDFIYPIYWIKGLD